MSVFIEGKERRGKRGHRDNRTLRLCNPSIIAPTNPQPYSMNNIEDYWMKAAVFAHHTGKAVVNSSAIQISINSLIYIKPPEAVLPGEMFVIDPDKDSVFIVAHPTAIVDIRTIARNLNDFFIFPSSCLFDLISLGKFPEACFVPCCLRYPAACCGEVH